MQVLAVTTVLCMHMEVMQAIMQRPVLWMVAVLMVASADHLAVNVQRAMVDFTVKR